MSSDCRVKLLCRLQRIWFPSGRIPPPPSFLAKQQKPHSPPSNEARPPASLQTDRSAMPSSSSSSSLRIIGVFSPPHDDPIIKGGGDTDDEDSDPIMKGGDTDEDSDGSFGGGGGALSRSVAERIASCFRTQASIDDVCRRYGVPPEQYTAVLPAAHHRACSPPPPGAICVHEHALEAGMRVPLHGFFCEVLSHFGVAPSQISPNGWRAMAGFVVLSHLAGVAPSLPVFRHFFSLCRFKFRGWYCFRGKDAAGALFKGMPSFITGWKEAFFFLKSPTPWPCPVKWGDLSKNSTVDPVLTREEQRVAKKLLCLRVDGAAFDIKTLLSERNLAAAVIAGSSGKQPPPPIPTTRNAACVKGMDPSICDVMMNLWAAKAKAAQAQAQPSGVKLTVKSERGGSSSRDMPSSSGKKRKATEDAAKQQEGPSCHEPRTPLDRAHASSPSSPGFCFSTKKSSKTSRERERDHGPITRNMAKKPDCGGGGGTSGEWEAARQMLQSIVTPALQQRLSAAEPSDVISQSYITALQAANYAWFTLGYALEAEEKLAAREREAEALRQELSQAKAELAAAKKAAAEAGEAAVREFRGSTEQVLRYAEHALAGYEKGMDDMKRAALRRYPHLDPEQLVVPADGGGAR